MFSDRSDRSADPELSNLTSELLTKKVSSVMGDNGCMRHLRSSAGNRLPEWPRPLSGPAGLLWPCPSRSLAPRGTARSQQVWRPCSAGGSVFLNRTDQQLEQLGGASRFRVLLLLHLSPAALEPLGHPQRDILPRVVPQAAARQP